MKLLKEMLNATTSNDKCYDASPLVAVYQCVSTSLKCTCDEKMLFSFSPDSDFIFGTNAPCQLLRLNFKKRSHFLTTISRLNCPPLPDYVPVELP